MRIYIRILSFALVVLCVPLTTHAVNFSNSLGIGVSSPSAKLSVNGNLSFENSLSNVTRGIYWYSNADAQYGAIFRNASTGDLTLSANTAGVDSDILLQAGGATRATIQGSAGRVRASSGFEVGGGSDGASYYATADNSTLFSGKITNASPATYVYLADFTASNPTGAWGFIVKSNSGADNEAGITGAGSAYADGSWNGGGFDYAEWVPPVPGSKPKDYPRGSLICIQLSTADTYGLCDDPYDRELVGIVSTNPAVVGNSPALDPGDKPREETHILLAMLGRVPTRVSLEGGPIRIGDRITASSVPGVGMKASRSGRTVGFSLENYDAEDLERQILVFIDPEFSIIPEE